MPALEPTLSARSSLVASGFPKSRLASDGAQPASAATTPARGPSTSEPRLGVDFCFGIVPRIRPLRASDRLRGGRRSLIMDDDGHSSRLVRKANLFLDGVKFLPRSAVDIDGA